ncbi:MAG: AraC family transcriptional regulator [bacterium]|nr:AraC family transcriptional regulator [bacterium]
MTDTTETPIAVSRILHPSDYHVQHPNVYFPDTAREGYFLPAKARRNLSRPPDEYYSLPRLGPHSGLLFNVLHAGTSHWEYGDRYTRVRSSGFAIELVTHGRGELRVGRYKRYILRPGDVFILHPDERHSYRACSRSPFQKMYVTLAIDSPMHRAILAATPLWEQSYLPLPPPGAGRAQALIERVIAIVRAGGADAALQASLTVCELITLLLQEVHTHSEAPSLDPRLHAVMTHAIDHLHERLSMTDLAKVAGVSAGHLNRLFMKDVGMRAHEWLLKLRMRYASELLHKTHLPIHHIAEQVGYDNAYTFSRAFKHVAGMAPVTYRRRVWQAR